MGTVSGVLHVVPGDFVSRERFVPEVDDVPEETGVRVWKKVRLNDETVVELFIDFDWTNMHLRIVNKSPTPIGQLALVIKKNSVGLTVTENPKFPEALEFGDVAVLSVPVKYLPDLVANADAADLQIALRTNVGTLFGVSRIPVEFALTDGGSISPDVFREYLQSFTATATLLVEDARLADDKELQARNVFVVGKFAGHVYVAFQLPSKAAVVAELAQIERDISAVIKVQDPALLSVVKLAAEALFRSK
jgi:hypothetical protein